MIYACKCQMDWQVKWQAADGLTAISCSKIRRVKRLTSGNLPVKCSGKYAEGLCVKCDESHLVNKS